MYGHFVQWSRSFFHWLTPNSDCYLCREKVTRSQNVGAPAKASIICHFCHERLPRLKPGCRVCAMPVGVAVGVAVDLCGECLKQAPYFDQTVAAFHYEPPVDQMITGLKFNASRHFLPLFCDYLQDAIVHSYHPGQFPQALIAIPLHPAKLKSRGFNQAQLLAKRLGQSLAIPICNRGVTKIKNTAAQSSLDATDRHKNIRGAFRVTEVDYRHVAIIDDVMTTGATANELARQLKQAGVERVDLWCVARAFH